MRNNNKLQNRILMGMFAFSTVAAPMLVAVPAEAASSKSSSDSVQKSSQYAKNNQKDSIVEHNKAEAIKMMSADKTEKEEPSATEFTDRIQSILDNYQPTNNYSRFLNAKVPNYAIDTSEDLASSDNESGLGENKHNFIWKGTPLTQSLYALGSVANKGIVVNGDLKGTVYANLRNVSFDSALDYLSRSYGFNWMMDGDNIIISTDKEMLQSEIFRVNYANKDKLKDELTSLGIDNTHIYSNSENGTVSVTGTPYQLQQARNHLKEIDKPVAQCLFVAQLIEVSHGKNLNLGMSYTLPTYSHSASEGSDDSTLRGNWLPKLYFAANSEASRSLSKGKVISRPMVLSKNGEQASVMFGDRVPIFSQSASASSTNVTVTYQAVGTSLDITPVINESTGDISIDLKAEVSAITNWESSGNTRAPQISTRDVTTSAHLKSGQSLVIGGLMNSKDIDNLSGIPGLMNLPILGQLFRHHTVNKEYSEVFVMITPYIMSEGLDPEKIAKQV